MLNKRRVLVIDDTASIRTFLRLSLEGEGADFSEAATGEEGLAIAALISPDVVILDLGLPDMDGMDVLPCLKDMTPLPAVIILSVRKDQLSQREAVKRGANAYVSKPFLVEELIETIENVLNQPR